MPSEFDIFCSYAHSDNDAGWVDEFASSLSGTYRKLTGLTPRVFVDRESLMTSDIWKESIKKAVDASDVLLAVVSPSYVRSEWCRREWHEFVTREAELRARSLLDDEQGLIFPILLFPLGRGVFDEGERAFAELIGQRQWLDVSSQLDGTPLRPDQVRRLGEEIIDTVSELQRRRRRTERAATSNTAGATIHDPTSGLEWSAALSPEPMTFEAAQKFVDDLRISGVSGWRLPTKTELESIIDPAALAGDADASPYPLLEPFNSQRSGYLHSGELVESDEDDEGHYIMNVRNGHIFNGAGYRCFVRAVRTSEIASGIY